MSDIYKTDSQYKNKLMVTKLKEEGRGTNYMCMELKDTSYNT